MNSIGIEQKADLDSVTATDFKALLDMFMFYTASLCLELDTTFFH